jgi:hypothetical protein
LNGGVLTPEAEANLIEYGQQNGLPDEQIYTLIDGAVQQNSARRLAAEPAAAAEAAPAAPADFDAEDEFLRILRLTDVNMGSATESVRRLLGNVAHNLGIDVETGDGPAR